MAGWCLSLLMVFAAACGDGSRAGGDGGGDDDGNSGGDGGGTDAPPAVSCDDLPPTCGANGNDSCCDSPTVTGATFHRSFDLAGDASSGTMMFPATLSEFRLDKYEVTVGRFRAYVEAGKGTQATAPAAGDGAHPQIASSGWQAGFDAELAATTDSLIASLKCDATFQTWTDAPGANENRPLNCVTWFQAMAFCIFDGGFLATEAEWNFAAAGGDQQRAFPWSSPAGSLTIDGAHASFLESPNNCVGDGAAGCTLADLVDVGSKTPGEGRFGHSDLAGNVMEWTLDFGNIYPVPCVDCASLEVADARVIRGGSFRLSATEARTGVRGNFPPENRSEQVGFRCARVP